MRYRIIVYETLSPATTPETCVYVAGLAIGYDAQPRWFCSGATADEARKRMEAFWEKEQRSHEPQTRPKKPPAPSPSIEEHPAIAVEDPGDVV